MSEHRPPAPAPMLLPISAAAAALAMGLSAIERAASPCACEDEVRQHRQKCGSRVSLSLGASLMAPHAVIACSSLPHFQAETCFPVTSRSRGAAAECSPPAPRLQGLPT